MFDDAELSSNETLRSNSASSKCPEKIKNEIYMSDIKFEN